MKALPHRKFNKLRYLIPGLISISLLLGLYQMMTVKGEENLPKFVLLRLEDIGPGGQYSTLEGLGKLRAVLEYLHNQHIHYSLAVIPRWINIMPDGTRYDRSLDQLNEPYIRSFDSLLHQAEQDGASIGMHGYTHQAGNIRRDDGQHETGIGNEFNIPGLPETATAAFAEKRVIEALHIFHNAGFVPRFWETPHYHSAPIQDRVFQAHFGLLYQSNAAMNPNPAAAQYRNAINSGYGASTLGSVYVPTPFSYVPYNKDERIILNQMGRSKSVHSFFYHPFLEFKYLVPVVDSKGNAVLKDGLPDYKYTDQKKSMLQKLTSSINTMGYQFYSIHDYVPFTPSHRIEVGNQREMSLQIGDVTGKGQADLVAWDRNSGNITVVEGNFRGMRNEPLPQPRIWATIPYTDGAAFALHHDHADGKLGLWVIYPNGRLESYSSDGSKFKLTRSWNIPSNSWHDLNELRQPNGDYVLAGQSRDHRQLLGIYMHNGGATTIKPIGFNNVSDKRLMVRTLNSENRQSLFLQKKDSAAGTQIYFDQDALQWKSNKVYLNIPNDPGEIHFGDFNGDGKEDILRWDSESLIFTVYLQTSENLFKPLSTFGPWGTRNGRVMVADFDGNGKQDLAILGNEEPFLDISLSFQSLNQ